MIFFFISKSALLNKIKSISKEDTNQNFFFFLGEKFRFASNEDANQFFFKEKFRSASKEDVDQFYFKKNLDLHLRKMQIRFLFEKIQIYI